MSIPVFATFPQVFFHNRRNRNSSRPGGDLCHPSAPELRHPEPGAAVPPPQTATRPPEFAASGPAGLSGTNLERAGDYNQRVVLQAIRARGPITRTELAETSGLTPPAIANITRRLAAEGLVLDA
ncbi:MAG: winged helix-turn-helix transcriptional regulator, partial [Caulobacteraceae bacterium]|nr:winged helix-turn-helix transcriptional regulator [Caulobacter sp.]